MSTAAATSALRPLPPLQCTTTRQSLSMRSTNRAINSSKAWVLLGARLSAAGRHAEANRTIVIRKARARQEGDFKRVRRGGEDRRRHRRLTAGPPVPKMPQRRIIALGPSVAEYQPFEGSPVAWFH